MKMMWVSWAKHCVITLKMLNTKPKQRSQDVDMCKWFDLLQIIYNYI